MTRRMLQWIAFAIAILPSSGFLVIAMISGMHVSRDAMKDFSLIFYAISIIILLVSLLFPKKVGKQ